MYKMKILSVLLSIFVFSKCTEKSLPRGVSMTLRPLYDSIQEFTCLDGTLKLPFSFVNDDYCDCLDGSDEPGTSACPNGRFYCHNVGYTPIDLPTSRVNDGVCDCCDASDEYLSSNCTNICHILGAEAKKAAEKEAEIASQGNELRLQMVAAGKDIRQQKQERLAALEADKLEAARLKEEASRLKQTAENAEFAAMEVYRIRKEEQKAAEEKRENERLEQEAKDMFNQLDSNHDNRLQTEELIVKEVFDQNKDGQITEEEFKVFFNTNTDVAWDSFLEVWPKLKPFFLLEKEQYTTTEETKTGQEGDVVTIDYDQQATEVPEHFDAHEEESSNYEEPEEEEAREENLEPKLDEEEFIKHEEDEEEAQEEKHGEDEEEEKQEEPEESKTEDKYDENTLNLIEEANKARSRFESAERSLQDVERELTRLKDSLEKDYGAEDEFIPLDGQCYTYSDREYTYKLCPFDQVVQMGKSGGSETRLGVWAGWQEDSDHKVMLYDKGQTCWNGPQRSTKVTLVCGLETSVIGASEPNKCEYELVFQTPASCKIGTVPQPADTHDEF